MKKISELLQKGNLTPKERVLLIIADIIKEKKEGKELLSEAEKHALTEGWKPKDNDEVKEYNRYINGWRLIGYAELDAQSIYLKTREKFLGLGIFLRDFEVYPIYREIKQALDELAKIKRVTAKEAIKIINKRGQEKLKKGYNLAQAIYELAFELMDEDSKKKLLEIDDEMEFYSQYLEEEQELAGLYRAKDFETIAERVSKNFYNPHSKEYMSWASYACIPLWEVARRYVKENRLPYKENTEKEDTKLIEARKPTSRDLLISTLVKHAQETKKTVEEIIKTTCLKWINEGLLEKDHPPLAICEPELFNKWVKTKEKAKEVLRELIDKKELETVKNKDGEEIITGDTLYNSNLKYKFITWYKQYVDDYDDDELLITDKKFLSKSTIHLEIARHFFNRLSQIKETEENGKIFLDLKQDKKYKEHTIKDVFLKMRNDFVNAYESLLTFEDLFKKVSKVYEMDLTYKIREYIAECKSDIEFFNNILLQALKGAGLPFSRHFIEDKTKTYKDKGLLIDVKKIDIWKIKPDNEIVRLYYKELTDTLGKEF